MSAAVAILDALRKKPVAEKKKQFSVAFFVASAAPKQRDTEERQERQDKQEKQEKPNANPNPTVKIVDKTALKLVNRDDILARIKAARGIVTEAAPNPLNLTVAKVVSIVEEAPVPRLKGKKLQKIKLIPVSVTQSIEKVVLPEVDLEEEVEEVKDKEPVEPLNPLKKKRGTRKRTEKDHEKEKDTEKEKEKVPAVVKKPIEPVVASEYYLNNREKFVEFINKLFYKNYRAEIMDESSVVSCEDRRSAEEFGLLTHQKIVKDYLNM